MLEITNLESKNIEVNSEQQIAIKGGVKAGVGAFLGSLAYNATNAYQTGSFGWSTLKASAVAGLAVGAFASAVGTPIVGALSE
ncbi:MAG: hypothetical protein AAFX80_00605 [Cyanobacteria bacterium J06639_18]